MTGKTHVTVGCVTMGCIAAKHLDGIVIHGSTILPLVALVTTTVGSYLPDIDLPQSHLGKKYYFISKHLKHRGVTHMWYIIPLLIFILLVMSVFFPKFIMRGINTVLAVILGGMLLAIVLPTLKRGNIDLIDAFHGSLLVVSLVTLFTRFDDNAVLCSLLFGFMFGWIMHIFADLFNKPGVPLIPGAKNVHVMSVKTQSFNEKGVFSRNWQEPVWLLCYCLIVIFFTFRGNIL